MLNWDEQFEFPNLFGSNYRKHTEMSFVPSDLNAEVVIVDRSDSHIKTIVIK